MEIVAVCEQAQNVDFAAEDFVTLQGLSLFPDGPSWGNKEPSVEDLSQAMDMPQGQGAAEGTHGQGTGLQEAGRRGDMMEDSRQEGTAMGEARRTIGITENIMKNLRCSLESACEIAGMTLSEYQQAKAIYTETQ